MSPLEAVILFGGAVVFLFVVGGVGLQRQAKRAAIERDRMRIEEEREWLAQNSLPAVYTATYANTLEMDADLGRLFSLGYEIEAGPTENLDRQWVVTLARRISTGTAPTM